MAPPRSTQDGTTEVLRPLLPKSSYGVWVEVLTAAAVPRRRMLTQGSIVLGAGLGADIVIDDPGVSRRHAQISMTENGVEVVDLESRNGTCWQGQRIHRVTLERDATLQLGRVCVRLYLRSADEAQDDAAPAISGILGQSPAMMRVFRLIERLSGSTVPVLITGESGTGKGLVARALHARSPLEGGPLITVNCAEIDPSSAREVFFGASNPTEFAGNRTAQGAFELAERGTLLLDEIGELPLNVQPLLLRVLDTETIARSGEARERRLWVRTIAASGDNLALAVEQGRFRKDLYFRLNAASIVLPPLRERGVDIELLAKHFAIEFGIPCLPLGVLQKLLRHAWPGNVRELRNVLRGYSLLGELPETDDAVRDLGIDQVLRRLLDLGRPYLEQKEELLNKFIDVYLSELLRRTNGNQSEAARIAGLDRAHLNKMVAKLRKSACAGHCRSEPANNAEG